MRRSPRCWCVALAGILLIGGCGDPARPPCLVGDQTQCQCPGQPDGGAQYGYRTCQAALDGGAAYGSCDCRVGLMPDLSSPLSTPYMSGMGSGNTLDAGHP